MKLATAFVEIAARTDEFRRQLDDARRLATTTADAIRHAFEVPPKWAPPTMSDRPASADNVSAGPVDQKLDSQRPASAATLPRPSVGNPSASSDIPTRSLADLLGSLFPEALPIGAPEPTASREDKRPPPARHKAPP